MLEDTGKYSTQAERRLDDTWSIFFLNNIHNLLLETNVLL